MESTTELESATKLCCKLCRTAPLHSSRVRGVRDRMMKGLGFNPKRCSRCGKRFYKWRR